MVFPPMNENNSTVCSEVLHGADEYARTVALRDEVLRKPLGLKFDPQQLTEEKDSLHLVCHRGGTLVGCVVLKPLPDGRAQMRQLAVAAACQRTGVGAALVAYAESLATRQGCREMILHSRQSAAGFYEKMGYTRHGPGFTEVTIPHILMRKTLKSGE